MINNDIFRRLRYAINASDNEIIKICSLKKFPVTYDDIKSFESKEDDEDFKEMSDMALQFFLDGLIIKRRGENPAEMPDSQSTIVTLSNTRVALQEVKFTLTFVPIGVFISDFTRGAKSPPIIIFPFELYGKLVLPIPSPSVSVPL